MRETQLRLMLRHEWQRSMRRWQPKWTALQTMLPRLHTGTGLLFVNHNHNHNSLKINDCT